MSSRGRTFGNSRVDLAGKPINVGDHGGSAEDIVRSLFKTLGLTISEVRMGQDEALEEMRQGRVAATAFLASKPAAIAERLISDGGFHLIPIPFSADSNDLISRPPSAMRTIRSSSRQERRSKQSP